MELGVRQFSWHEQFHGIPWNLKCANFADASSSMEFHGTWSVPISLTQAVSWNSMELWVRQFRWHEQFHGFHNIPWNLECANLTDTSSSKEFHGIAWNLKCANFAERSSSMEFHGTWSAPISLTRADPWNSIKFHGTWNGQFSWHEQFHGIPWNCMELQVPKFRWHEQFHGIPWNLKCAYLADASSSMEFMELGVRQFRWQEQFHEIPWNLECANFADTIRSLEFHKIPWNLECAN